MFRVGQKVVCVNAINTDADNEIELHKGEIYTVRWCGIWESPYNPADLCVRLIGIIRPEPWTPCPEMEDVPFRASRFRPAVDRKTSIEIFQKMLNPSRENSVTFTHPVDPPVEA